MINSPPGDKGAVGSGACLKSNVFASFGSDIYVAKYIKAQTCFVAEIQYKPLSITVFYIKHG